MRLEVTGIETIELSDPKGLCNRPAVVPVPMPSNPSNPWPAPVTPFRMPGQYTGAPAYNLLRAAVKKAEEQANETYIWSKALPTTVSHKDRDYHEKWGKGLSAGDEPPKWVQNWQTNMSQ